MSENRREQFHAMLSGSTDVPPFMVSAWQHFIGHEYGAKEFADATIAFVRKWDWDWVKINSRAVYYAEAWGSQYDHNDYPEIPEPKPLNQAIKSWKDLASITELNPSLTPEFAEHIDSARMIREAFPDRAVIQTIFNPLSVLMQLALIPLYPGAHSTGVPPTTTRDELIFNHPIEAKEAIKHIASTLAKYAAALVTPIEQGGSGLDGIFLASTGMASEDYFDHEQYAEYAAPYDAMVINAVHQANPDAKVVFHTCRQHSHPEWFTSIGAQALQWDQFLDRNPELSANLGIVPIGGASFTEFAPEGNLDTIREELDDAIEQCSNHPFLLAPSCTIPTPASDKALQILSDTRTRLR